MKYTNNLFAILASLYGDKAAYLMLPRLLDLLSFSPSDPQNRSHMNRIRLSEKDAFLITYGDQVQDAAVPHLRSLAEFCEDYLKDRISAIHLLPFFPYSSDDGFSVIDYRKVNPMLGEWGDLQLFRNNFKLMFDAVINHVSTKHQWFQQFLDEDPRYADYFVVIENDPDLSQVVRPRTHTLLTEFRTVSGMKRVWTTFSEDQVDLNFRNPEVLREILDLLLFYGNQGADFIRLDAIAYLWKEPGTTCIHLPQTHQIIQLFRTVFDLVAPRVLFITETNVPHEENVSYFGDGTNEAQLVYNFALPPLVLHTIRTGSSHKLSRWAQSLRLPSDQVTFFNFLASHDGIGINPVRGILSEADIGAMVNQCLKHGGLVSHKRNSDGSESPYELNINYFDALSGREDLEPLDLQIDRFIAAHAILLSFIGIPAIYFHSLFGSRGWIEGPKQTGRNRTINRQKLLRHDLEKELSAPQSLRAKVFDRLCKLIEIRRDHPAFDPHGKQEVIGLKDSVFALIRTAPHGHEQILCVQNVTSMNQLVHQISSYGGINLLKPSGPVQDGAIGLLPYESRWILLS